MIDDRRYRVKELAEGEVCIHTYEDESGSPHRVILKRGKEIELHAGGARVIMTPDKIDMRRGGGRVEITNGGVAISGGSLTHNGTNVGDDHTHGGVNRGSQSTDGPD